MLLQWSSGMAFCASGAHGPSGPLRAGSQKPCRTGAFGTSDSPQRILKQTLRPLFITLEGGEGAGKSTQARMLAAWLAQQGRAVLLTREPGGAPGAETLRRLLLSGEHDWSAAAETLLHFAARAEHIARSIRPALEAGMVVVCDRFADSTMAYQGYGQGADRAAIATLTGLLGLAPDLTLVLDIDDAEARGAAGGARIAA